MTTVHMIYTGIVNFVTARSGGAVHVVLQNARHHDHWPWLVAEKDHVVAGRNPPKPLDLRGESQQPDHLVAFELEGVDVEIDNTIESERLRVRPSFERFVLDSNEAFVEYPHRPFQRGHLYGHEPETIAARFKPAAGSLEASWVNRYYQWRYRHQRGRWLWVAQQVCHTFEIAEDQLELVFENGQNPPPRLTVRPDSSGTIEVLVGNTLLADVFPTGNEDDVEKVDDHVKLYYDMVDRPVPDLLRFGLESRRAAVPLSNPPQKTHHHRLTKSKSSAEASGRRGEGEIGIRSLGGANCPPNNWNG